MGTMTAGQLDITGLGDYFRGYNAPLGFGSITGEVTAYGTIESLFTDVNGILGYGTNASVLGFEAGTAVGTPTSFTIGSTTYTLTPQGGDAYTIDSYAGFANTVLYNWSFTPASTFTLDAQGGAFALTGGTANFPVTRKLDAQGGTYALTGGTVSFIKGYPIAATGGTFAMTGGSVNFPVTRVVTATGGTFAFTGGSVNLNKGRILDAQGGTYSLTGGTANFPLGRVMTASGGVFSLTGGTAGLSKGRTLSALGGTFSFTGGTTTFPVTRRLDAEGGIFVFTGGETTMVPFYKSYAYTGQKNARFSAPHVRASMSMRRSTSFSSRR